MPYKKFFLIGVRISLILWSFVFKTEAFGRGVSRFSRLRRAISLSESRTSLFFQQIIKSNLGTPHC